MKAETYEALSKLNTAFEQVTEALKKLQENGVVTVDWVQEQGVITCELCAGMNALILNKLSSREVEDREHFGKMRSNIEARLKHLSSSSSETKAPSTS